jgi:hypothetical protein
MFKFHRGLWQSSASGKVRVASRGQEIVTVASKRVCFTCISCVQTCLLHVYQLRLELSTPSMTSCVPRLVRNCISWIQRYGYTKCPTIERFLHSFIVTLYKIICTNTKLLNDIDNTVAISCYCLIFKPYFKKFRRRRQAHYVPNIAHLNLLLWSDENTFFGKSFNAVSLRVRSTWPSNCAHTIIIHSAETPVRYVVNIL